jgi:hypothetical protein
MVGATLGIGTPGGATLGGGPGIWGVIGLGAISGAPSLGATVGLGTTGVATL